MNKVGVAILGSGNIGTDLMIKVVRTSKRLELKALVGIDPHSDGLERARCLGIPTTHAGLDGLLAMPQFAEIKIVFDATSAKAHRRHDAMLRTHGKQLVDLTPAALGPYTVPAVGARFDLDAPNINMVSCGGQATIPIVAAVSRVARVRYAEIVASISSRSAGAGTRANIDEFTKTTARGLEIVGGAERGKAIIVLNPAEPPLIMRNTVFTLTDDVDQARVNESIEAMVKEVQTYVPGYRLKQAVQFECFGSDRAVHIPGHGRFTGLKASVFLEVAGAAHYLPEYAGNLDIMTAAALAASERLAELKFSA